MPKYKERKLILRNVPLSHNDQDVQAICIPHGTITRLYRRYSPQGNPLRSYNLYTPDTDAAQTLYQNLKASNHDIELVITPKQENQDWASTLANQLGQTNAQTRFLIRRCGEVLGKQIIEQFINDAINTPNNTPPARVFKETIMVRLQADPETWDKVFHTPVPATA